MKPRRIPLVILISTLCDICAGIDLTWTIVHSGTFNSSLTELSLFFSQVHTLVHENSDTAISCFLEKMFFNQSAENGKTVNVTLSCMTSGSVFLVDRANNRLYKAVQAEWQVSQSYCDLRSTLPFMYNDLPFNPDDLTKEEIIIIAVTITVSAGFFLTVIFIILKIQQKSENRRSKGTVTPSSSEETNDNYSDISDHLEDPSSDNRGRRQTLADITPSSGASAKVITEWQPSDFYPVDHNNDKLSEKRVKKRIYQLTSDRSFQRLFIFGVDTNGSLQKLRCEIMLKVKRRTGSTMFIFLNEDLKGVSPQSECSYIVSLLYQSPTILIRMLKSNELNEHGWMLCPCGNIGKQYCNCQQQLYCSRFCQQQELHRESCDVVRPTILDTPNDNGKS